MQSRKFLLNMYNSEDLKNNQYICKNLKVSLDVNGLPSLADLTEVAEI